MAGANKESKENKEKKAARSESIGSDSGALLRHLAEEITALRLDVEVLKSAPSSPSAETETPALTRRKGKKSVRDAEGSTIGIDEAADSVLWQSADDTQVARIGYAFSSVPKVALVRALLQEGPLPAAKLGELTGLTTGSLYHHLRELTHADVLASEGRNRFALTERGRRLALLLFMQAQQA